jgi:hypothetical protein
MFASPLLFDRIGWRGVANATPNFMLYAGLPFFAGCIAFTFLAGRLAAGPAGLVLFGLVMTGAIMQARRGGGGGGGGGGWAGAAAGPPAPPRGAGGGGGGGGG